MVKTLYMIVTPDKYEFPLLIADNINELIKYSGKSKNTIMSSISHNSSGKYSGMKFVRVKVNMRKDERY